MKISNKIYTDITSKRKLSRIKKRIQRAKFCPGIFVVTYPVFNYGILEVYDYRELLQGFYRNIDDRIEIVGISESKAGAMYLVTCLVEEMSQKWALEG